MIANCKKLNRTWNTDFKEMYGKYMIFVQFNPILLLCPHLRASNLICLLKFKKL